MARNELAASFHWTDNQLAQLTFSRSGTPIVFTGHTIDLNFKDPRGNGEIQKILLDPQYHPGNASTADFFLETTITSPVSNQRVSETALCNWNSDKSIAVGTIEDDGGRLVIVAESVTDELKTSRFSFLIMPMSGFSGFRIAQDVPVGSESPGLIGIEAKLKRPTAVLSEISFPPTLARGSKGNVVSALQTGLKRFDVPNSPTDPGPVDGDFGPRTESAVRAYQSHQNITVDGVVGHQTWWVPAGAAGATLASLAGLV
jgi:peptidoglycan hydrolase-like protein with peptidoglycan-binding domain